MNRSHVNFTLIFINRLQMWLIRRIYLPVDLMFMDQHFIKLINVYEKLFERQIISKMLLYKFLSNFD